MKNIIKSFIKICERRKSEREIETIKNSALLIEQAVINLFLLALNLFQVFLYHFNFTANVYVFIGILIVCAIFIALFFKFLNSAGGIMNESLKERGMSYDGSHIPKRAKNEV